MSWLLSAAPRWHYLAILIACVVLTLPLELLLGARVYRQPVRLLATITIASSPFVVIDWLAVRAGLWAFSPRHVLGISVGGRLPLEELLFFVVVPLCALLTHGAVVNGAQLRGKGRRR